MRIQETECDSNIHLSKFKFNCDEVDPSVPKPLPQNLNHCLLIVGKPDSFGSCWLLVYRPAAASLLRPVAKDVAPQTF